MQYFIALYRTVIPEESSATMNWVFDLFDLLTGEVAKDLEDILAAAIIWSTLALAGRYSEGGGSEEDIPYLEQKYLNSILFLHASLL